MFLVAGMGVIESRTRIVRIILVVLEGAQAAAEDDRQIVGRVQARGQVQAILALGAFVLAVFREVLFRQIAAPVVDAARDQFEGAGVVGRAGLARVGSHEASHQFMLAASQGEGAGDVHVSGVLHAMTFPATPVQEHAFTGGTVRVAATGRGQASVVIGGFLVERGLERPVVGQGLFQGGEVGDVVEVATTPVGARVEVTREVGTAAVREVHRVAGPGRASRGGA
ncbi:hypothetical protein D3C81_1014750 [compost metagenome]